MYVCFDNMQYVYCHSSATLTEVFPSFFPSCKANSGVKLAKTGHGLHSSKLVVICVVLLLFVLFYVLSVCKCVLYRCHRVSTQLQLINISYHSMSRNVGDYQSVSEQPIGTLFKVQAVPLKKRSTGCSESSANKYQPTLRYTPETRRSEITRHLLESPILCLYVISS